MGLKIKIGLWGVFFMFLGGTSIWRGVSWAWVAWTNGVPLVLSCRDYGEKGTKARWVELTKCEVDYTKAVVIYERGYQNATEKDLYMHTFVPLRGVGEERGKVIGVLKKMESRVQIALVHRWLRLKKRRDRAGMSSFRVKHKGKLRRVETVKGLLRFGDRINSDAYTQLRLKVPYRLASRYAVLDMGRKPEGGLGLFFVVVGMVFGLAGIGIMGKALKAKEPSEEVEDAIELLTS